MDSCMLSGFLGFVMLTMLFASGRGQVTFSQNYNVAWGKDHFSSLNGDTEVQLKLDRSSGAGLESKSHLLSGLINMKIKIPQSKSSGVITTFYLTSKGNKQDELDFEFIGSNGPPYSLSTNVFTKGVGSREQKFRLWFDPSTDFHSYTILWNKFLIVFFVDDVPIRVFKNLGGEASYPTYGMQVIGTLWAAEEWAGKVDWSKAPFTAHYQNFDIDGVQEVGDQGALPDINGCVVPDVPIPGLSRGCYYNHMNALWSWRRNRTLSARQIMPYQNVRRKYLVYDYCTDRARYPDPFPECKSPIGIHVAP
ncbi:hypothetical protein BT93_K0204 [Corymbia citriodora subsp. variegata]|nr:hypothetical protein BT93_K0204 [Corymbia citriodora subsp. variegata]